MSRKKTAKDTVTASSYGGVVHHNVLNEFAAKSLKKIGPHLQPWALGFGMLPVTGLTHLWLGDSALLPVFTGLGGAAATGLVAATWHVSRFRNTIGRIQSAATTAVASGWLLAATITGPFYEPLLVPFGVVGAGLAALWNIRNVHRSFEPDEASGGVGGSKQTLFKQMMTASAEKAGMEIGVKNVKVGPNRISGTVNLSDGDTVDDLQRTIPAMEAAGRMPTGALVATPNRHNAGEPTLIMTDPTILEDPILWPGPSRPGGSIADPLRVGMFQDATPIELILPGSHWQIMGMTGSAKSTGIGWSILGEIISRRDVVVMFVDITKGKQTVGPLTNAMHRIESTPDRATALIGELQAILSERTDQLAEKGLLKWAPGCGVPYLVAWLEEAADVFDKLGNMEDFINLLRALRSAGGSIIWSLQRADSTQMPTLFKGQISGHICAGVANDHDAQWGLSPAQDKAGATPELWGKRYPGMAYVDAEGVEPERVAMPGRFFDWGTTDPERVANMTRYADMWPASEKQLDALTAKLVGGEVEPDELGDVLSEYLQTEDPNPEMPNPDINAPLEGVPDMPLGGAPKMEPAQAREFMDEYLQRFADGRPFGPRDLGEVLEATGMKRPWAQKVLKERLDAGVLVKDPNTGMYRVARPLVAA